MNCLNILRKGLIYFPDFCHLILKWFRNNEEQEENFKQNMFKVSIPCLEESNIKLLLTYIGFLMERKPFQMLCGTDPFPTDFRAKKYKLDKHSISKVSQ